MCMSKFSMEAWLTMYFALVFTKKGRTHLVKSCPKTQRVKRNTFDISKFKFYKGFFFINSYVGNKPKTCAIISADSKNCTQYEDFAT